jgi:excisionase family DNA binding protein
MEASMDLEDRLAAIEEKQNRILSLLEKREVPSGNTLTLKEAAEYVGYSADHFRRLAVEQRMIPFVRPSGQQKGKILFRKADLDHFLGEGGKDVNKQPGRKRKSPTIRFW